MMGSIIKIALIVLVVFYIIRLFKFGRKDAVSDNNRGREKRINTDGLDIKDAKYNDIEEEK
jgi:hypothetical protein